MCRASGRSYSWPSYVPVILASIVIGLALPATSVLANPTHITPETNHEISELIAMDDDELLNIISKKSFDYFWLEANPNNGLIRHYSEENSPSGIAAVGLGLTAIPVGIKRGWISREEGYKRTITTLITLTSDKISRENGFFYQFLDMSDGSRFNESQVSSMDTCILIAGVLFVGEFFSGTPVQDLAYDLYSQVNWRWMMNSGETPAKSWTPEAGFSKARWDSFGESLIMYVLAIGSPTYPIPTSAWHNFRRPVRENYISTLGENLASYVLPHVWLDLRGKGDYYANYWNNVVFAARYNRIYSMLKCSKSTGHTLNIWGLGECEGPGGYCTYGASAANYDGTLTPYAPMGCMPFSPDISMQAIREVLRKHGELTWAKYGFTSGFNVDKSWWSGTHHAINQGISLLMIENYRTVFIWKHAAGNHLIQRGLDHIQFSPSKTSEAVTPAYLMEIEGKHYSWDF